MLVFTTLEISCSGVTKSCVQLQPERNGLIAILLSCHFSLFCVPSHVESVGSLPGGCVSVGMGTPPGGVLLWMLIWKSETYVIDICDSDFTVSFTTLIYKWKCTFMRYL